MIVAHYDYTQIQIQIHVIEGHTFATIWNTDYKRGPIGQIIEKDWTPDQKYLADKTLLEYFRTNQPAESDGMAELEKIRNRVTEPILRDAKSWLNRQPRSLDEKKAYSDAAWNILTFIFPEGAQKNHTIDRLEKIFFN